MASLIRYPHPQVNVDPAIPVPSWGLSEVGRARTEAVASTGPLSGTTQIVSSRERKAIETAEIIAAKLNVDVEVREALHENDRSATGFYQTSLRRWLINFSCNPTPAFEVGSDFQRGDAYFAVALNGVSVAREKQSALVEERQIERRTEQFLVVHITTERARHRRAASSPARRRRGGDNAEERIQWNLPSHGMMQTLRSRSMAGWMVS